MKMSEIKEHVTTEISTRTARRRAHELGFNNRVACKKPFLKEHHQRLWLQFARAHKNWTVEDWKKVLWTDESSFEIGKFSRQVVFWRKKEEKYKKKCLVPTFKSGQTSTMVWGAFFGHTRAPLAVVPPGQQSAKNLIDNIYDKELIPFLEEADPDHKLTLMEDNAPVHTAQLSREYLSDYDIKKMDWLAQSLDLNPIENVWKVLKSNVQELYQPRSVKEMHEALNQAWADFPDEILNHLIDSMPRRMEAVIEAKGGPTRW